MDKNEWRVQTVGNAFLEPVTHWMLYSFCLTSLLMKCIIAFIYLLTDSAEVSKDPGKGPAGSGVSVTKEGSSYCLGIGSHGVLEWTTVHFEGK